LYCEKQFKPRSKSSNDAIGGLSRIPHVFMCLVFWAWICLVVNSAIRSRCRTNFKTLVVLARGRTSTHFCGLSLQYSRYEYSCDNRLSLQYSRYEYSCDDRRNFLFHFGTRTQITIVQETQCFWIFRRLLTYLRTHVISTYLLTYILTYLLVYLLTYLTLFEFVLRENHNMTVIVLYRVYELSPCVCRPSYSPRIPACGAVWYQPMNGDEWFDWFADIDPRRLARSSVHRNGQDLTLGGALFHHLDDVRQLRTVQSSRCHSRRRILVRSRGRYRDWLVSNSRFKFSHCRHGSVVNFTRLVRPCSNDK